jgi:hypothetical protein
MFAEDYNGAVRCINGCSVLTFTLIVGVAGYYLFSFLARRW